MDPKTHCDCGWQFPRHFRLLAKVRDESKVPEGVTVSLDCPQCGKAWHMDCSLKFMDRALAV
jgi:hypothetical protein